MKQSILIFLDPFLVQLILFSFFGSKTLVYLGPGAGLGLIGTLFAVVIVILVIVFGLILYPIRCLKRRNMSKTAHEKKDGNSDESHENVT